MNENNEKMDFNLETIISMVGLVLGGGGIGAIFTWRWQRAKSKFEAEQAKAEAEGAEVSAAKEMQDMYQQMIADVKADRDEQKQYISELKADRQQLREERDELRTRIDRMEETVRGLQRDVARNGRMVEVMRPFLCGRQGCPERVFVTITDDGEVQPKPKKTTARKTTK